MDKRRYVFEIAFDGTAYHGWQRQSDVISVQETIEKILIKVLKHKLICHGCGRTDKGVHATQFFFHFDSFAIINKQHIEIIKYNLPPDILFKDWQHVSTQFNVQRDASSRTYIFNIHNHKNPFINRFSSLYIYEQLDHEKLKKCLNLILGRHNFKAFCKTPDRHRGTNCTIMNTSYKITPDGICITITANRFLKHMMRILTKVLLDIASGKSELSQFRGYLNEQILIEPYSLLSPNGLFLEEVKYGLSNL